MDPVLTHPPLLDLLVQLIAIIASARLGGRAARHFGQPRAVGEIVSGIGIGAILTSGLIPLPGPLVGMASSPTLGLLSGLGLVLVVFQIGLEFAFYHLRDRDNRRATLLIAAMGIIVPFASGLGLGLLAREADRLAYALFMATAFTITALPVLGRILIEPDLHRTCIGTIAIAAAAVTDVVGWLLLGAVTALTLARFPVPELDLLPGDLMAVVLVAALSAGAVTEALGIYAVFGASSPVCCCTITGASWPLGAGRSAASSRCSSCRFSLLPIPAFTGMRLGITDLNTGGLFTKGVSSEGMSANLSVEGYCYPGKSEPTVEKGLMAVHKPLQNRRDPAQLQ